MLRAAYVAHAILGFGLLGLLDAAPAYAAEPPLPSTLPVWQQFELPDCDCQNLTDEPNGIFDPASFGRGHGHGHGQRKGQGRGSLFGPQRDLPPRPGPNVPEPMVFDLIRPLGVRRGELEVNVLGFAPLRRTRTRTPQFSFITGADQGTEQRAGFEWAPEIEYAPIDNFAVEFELPMAGPFVEAYKLAAQYTMGTAFDEAYIHGLQGILFIDNSNGAVTPTLLYIGAMRFDEVYSAMFMLGFSHSFGGEVEFSQSLILLNGVLFAEISDRVTLGLEVNYIADLDGSAGLLFIPQVHWDVTERLELQVGVGTRAQEGTTIGEAIFRVVSEF